MFHRKESVLPPFLDYIREAGFDCTPPIIADLCSVQAVGVNPAGPILTIYHEQPSAAADWIAEAARLKRFENYLRRRNNGSWERWNVDGIPTDGGNVLLDFPFQELTAPVHVDRVAFLEEVREFTGDAGMSLIVCREGHADASAADHSNFNVICRRMIGDADAADLEHVIIIDSRKWPCPVTGVFANIARLSLTLQDVFLDRVPWLQNSLPLAVRDFRDSLAHRLAMLRQSYVCELLRNCGHVARMSESRISAMVADWMMASPGDRCRFALHIIETLAQGLIHEKHTAESFSPEVVQRHGAAVVKDYTKNMIYP